MLRDFTRTERGREGEGREERYEWKGVSHFGRLLDVPVVATISVGVAIGAKR